MKTAPNSHIYSLWQGGGPFVGSNGAPHGRVTVEIGWQLRASGVANIGTYHRGPIRWFQRTNNSQVETEIPNIMTINIDRSIDNDSATCKIVMLNQKMNQNGTVTTGTAGESVGTPGYYLPTHADSSQAVSRWGFSTNAWNDVLQPNALIRTYQGYGGRSKTISQALTDGNIVQTGLWLVDDVQMDAATGDMTISCRDMAKLLIEQTLYPPLVPTAGDAHYPLHYYKWLFDDHHVIPYGNTIYKTGYIAIENDTVAVGASSYYSANVPALAIDGTDPDTYWISGGHTTGDGSADFEYIEFDVNTTIEGFNLQTYGGNYTVFASVKVGGAWQGTASIPTSAPGMNLPYVMTAGVGWEAAAQFQLGGAGAGPGHLPGQYVAAQKLRLTFTHLAKTSLGPNYFRCGIRDLTYGNFLGTVTGGGRTIVGIQRGYYNKLNGYWLAGSDGGVFTFGRLKFYGSEGSAVMNQPIIGIAGDDLGTGYRLVGTDGGVFCFGKATYKGSLPGIGVVTTIAAGIETGDAGAGGYYVFLFDGSVYAFGNAAYHGNYTGLSGLCMAMGVDQVHNGYWLVNQAGVVQAHGGASHHGDLAGSPPATNIRSIVSSTTGNGYWMVAEDGAVYAFGDVQFDYYGGMNGSPLNGKIVDMAQTGSNHGYWLVGEDGGVFAFGDAQFSGSLPEQFAVVRDGNYSEYLDIIKDLLLWSGWWFWNPALGDATPANVFGNLETTGIYAPTDLTEDFFDKKPVIDVINTLKEITGYVAYADEVGAYNYKTPNVWSIGNFLDTGAPTALIPTIDEALQITGYQVDVNDTDARSQIIIATADPQVHFTDTKSVTITSQWGGDMLRGIVRPALWVNGQFLTTAIQTTMANLIDLHLFMAQRQGTLTMPANPILQIDDQVRIFERSTSETYIHYLRGYSSTMDMSTGEYTMTLQTHWMGDGTTSGWFLSYT